MKQAAFASAHPQDRAFFALNVMFAWVAIVMGFSPGLVDHVSGATPFPPAIVHVHAVVFTGWLALFTAQIWLIRSGRVDLHRRLGVLGASMVPVVVIVGTVTNFVTQRIHLQAGAFEPGFFVLAIVDMLRFACLAGAGLLLRRHSAAHKRLLLRPVDSQESTSRLPGCGAFHRRDAGGDIVGRVFTGVGSNRSWAP